MVRAQPVTCLVTGSTGCVGVGWCRDSSRPGTPGPAGGPGPAVYAFAITFEGRYRRVRNQLMISYSEDQTLL
jgi:hypothetical protein